MCLVFVLFAKSFIKQKKNHKRNITRKVPSMGRKRYKLILKGISSLLGFILAYSLAHSVMPLRVWLKSGDEIGG